jgi:hypothetical protein
MVTRPFPFCPGTEKLVAPNRTVDALRSKSALIS